MISNMIGLVIYSIQQMVLFPERYSLIVQIFKFQLPRDPLLDGRLHGDLWRPRRHRDDDRQQQRRPLAPRAAVGLRPRGHPLHGRQQDELNRPTVDPDFQVSQLCLETDTSV